LVGSNQPKDKTEFALGLDCTAFADAGLELPPEEPPGRVGRPPAAERDAPKKPVRKSKKKGD
jgi:hypothetical protein